MQNNLGEVAQLRQQINLACEAAQRGMSGYAITASHEFITHRLRPGREEPQRNMIVMTTIVSDRPVVSL
jgi:hypothetical protein